MRALKDFQLENKKVLLRVDFNVPLDKKGKILDDFRIKKTLPTINYLREKKAKIILISHLGRPLKNQKIKAKSKKYSLKLLVPCLENLFKAKVKFLEDCIGSKVKEKVEKMKGGEISLLENLRFHPEEEENNPRFAQELAELGDYFIQDAFGVCHRSHASVVELPKYLPSGMGLLLEREIKVLSKILREPWHPLVVIIGGIKIGTKIGAIRNFLKKADSLLIGGEIANVILRVKGICLSKPLPDEKIIDKLRDLQLTNPKLHLPVDVIVSPDKTGQLYIREEAPAAVRKEEEIFDIGPETIRMFSEIIKKAKMILWSGPLGFFENPLFEKGTKIIGDKIARNHKAFKVAGGGDTILALKKFHLREQFDFISTGGGAMLRFLGGEKLPGIEALK
jgi:3-phosphoglycerate kinase